MMISDTETRVMTTETRVMTSETRVMTADVTHVTPPAPATQLTRTFRMVTIKQVDMNQVIPELIKIMVKLASMITAIADPAKMLNQVTMTTNITVYQDTKVITPRKRLRRMKTLMIGGRIF